MLVNVRYLVMSVALSGSLRGGRLRFALQAQALVDASFAISHGGEGEYDVGKLFGASCPQWMCWVLGTATGLILTPPPTFIHTFGLDTALPAFFLILGVRGDAQIAARHCRRCAQRIHCRGHALLCPAGSRPAGCRAGRRDRTAARRPLRVAREGENTCGSGFLARWVTIANWLLKASGPLVIGDRRLPRRMVDVSALIARR